jgi:hypothetical protein
MKQTAVDYIRQHFIMDEEFEKLFQDAKKMEKEQMLEVSKEGIFSTHEFEQYYNQTYGEL